MELGRCAPHGPSVSGPPPTMPIARCHLMPLASCQMPASVSVRLGLWCTHGKTNFGLGQARARVVVTREQMMIAPVQIEGEKREALASKYKVWVLNVKILAICQAERPDRNSAAVTTSLSRPMRGTVKREGAPWRARNLIVGATSGGKICRRGPTNWRAVSCGQPASSWLSPSLLNCRRQQPLAMSRYQCGRCGGKASRETGKGEERRTVGQRGAWWTVVGASRQGETGRDLER